MLPLMQPNPSPVSGETVYAEIGFGILSKTLFPAAFQQLGLKYSYVNCPGFLDNRKDEEKICTTISTQLVICLAKRIQASGASSTLSSSRMGSSFSKSG